MKPLRILLADDNALICEMIEEQLHSDGHSVTSVHSGEAAVASFLESPPELILIDLEMPGIGGLEAIRRIRKTPGMAWTPIIVITAHTDEANILESFMAGADDFLTKPIQPLLLDIRIRAMMRIVAVQRSSLAMVEHVIEGIIRINCTGRITAFNKAAETMFGYSASEVLGQNVSMLMPTPHRGAHDGHIGNYLATGKGSMIGVGRQMQGMRKNGEIFPLHIGISEVETSDDRFFVGLIRDLSVETELRSKLSESRHFLSDIFEHHTAVSFVKDSQGIYQLVNRKYEEIVGKSRNDVIGKTDPELFPPDLAEAYRKADRQVMESGVAIETEERLAHANGDSYFLSVKFPTRNGAGEITGICGMATDITELKRTQNELEYLSQHDELTKLFNRRHFMARARHEIIRAERYDRKLAILMLDIDHFKLINDNHGHRSGDQVIAAIGSQIQQMLRDADIAGRMGGEEFAILLPETDLAPAYQVAERLRSHVAETPIWIDDGKQIRCTLSIGVASLTATTNDIEDLLHAADTLLYAAKHAGRNQVVSSADGHPA